MSALRNTNKNKKTTNKNKSKTPTTIAPKVTTEDAFAPGLLKGFSLGLFAIYIFLTPIFIQDDLRRCSPSFQIALYFLPLLAIIKIIYGLLHFMFNVKSQSVINLLLTMILLSAYVLHSDINSDRTFNDVYLSSTVDNNISSFMSRLPIPLPFPSFLDIQNAGIGMPAAVAELKINSMNLMYYHWLLIIGVASSIALHQKSFPIIQRKGRIGLGLFFILYGFSILTVNEIQRVWLSFFMNQLPILSSESLLKSKNNSSSFIQQILITVAFVNIFCGLCSLFRKRLKISSILMFAMFLPLLLYEVNVLNEATVNQSKIMLKLDKIPGAQKIEHLMAYHTRYIYPVHYLCLRILQLIMIFSGILVEMLGIYDSGSGGGKKSMIVDEEGNHISKKESKKKR